MLQSFVKKPLLFLRLFTSLIGITSIGLFFFFSASDPTRIFSPDSYTYINSAQAMLQRGQFAISPDAPYQPQIMRTPGYPIFLATIFSIVGERYSFIILIQILLGVGTVYLTYHIAAHLWNRKIGVCAGILLSLDLASFISAHQILTETLFTFTFVLTLLIGMSCISRPRRLSYKCVLYSLLLALVTLIRPIIYYGMVFSLLFFPIIWRRVFRTPYTKIFRLLCFLLLPWTLLIGGWHIRNYVVAGITEISGIQNYNLLFYRGAGVVAQRDNIAFEEAQQHLGYGHYADRYPETQGWSFAQLNRRWKKDALKVFKEYPFFLLKTQVWGMVKLLLGPAETTFLGYMGYESGTTGPAKDLFKLSLREYTQKWVVEAPLIFGVFLFTGGHLTGIYLGIAYSIIARWRLYFSHWTCNFFLWGWLFYFIIISSGPEAYSRFRVPIMPLLCIYAAYSLYRVFRTLYLFFRSFLPNNADTKI